MAPDIVGLADSCCGCGACAAACPIGCIDISADDCGFPYPVIGGSCIECGLCDKICPSLNSAEEDGVEGVFWARVSDESLLMHSSSGGIFGALALNTLRSGGVVYGAAFVKGCRAVRHIRICDEAHLDSVMRSKYLQSNVGNSVYRQVEEDMRARRRVLFAGTACQVAGLRGFLAQRRSDLDGLLCVDVICHGVPSPKFWAAWLDHIAEGEGADVASVNFRSKSTGWSAYSVEYKYSTEKASSWPFMQDWYIGAFLSNASVRPSCFSCPSKRSCGSDITLGDFWGIQAMRPEIDCSKGVSAVVCNTKWGHDAFLSMSNFECGEASFDEVLRGNPALVESALPHVRSAEFLSDIASGMLVSQMKDKWNFEPTLVQKLRRKLGALKRKAISLAGR